ncbi:PAS domain-containing protein [Psychroflexus sediminis]|uniref:histidine kinase n=1 Tax=Psychroflexus sediminis TaxID=470826 RepID=A0A1G7XIE4_9FLAO|nr:PAS domain-containing protein [Psychroflexus sediminis]SDG83978.1 PAS domain S-box-containing protein [Psychroflexus sediminis]
MQNDILINHIPQSLKNSKLYDVVVTDLDGHYIFVNAAFQNRFSFITNDFIGKHSTITMHPEEYLKTKETVIKCLSHPQHCFPVELRKPLPNGKGYNWTQWEFSAMLDENQQAVGILCVGFDITGPGHNNLKLKEFQTKLTKTIESIPHPLLILDAEQTINFVNTEFELVFGFSICDIVGKKLDLLFPKHLEEKYKRLIDNYVTENPKKIRVNHFRTFKNNANEDLTVGVSLNSFLDDDNLNIIMIIEDLTMAKQNQDIIINQNNAFRQIAWKHSHELRKPVANILGLSNLLDLKNLKSDANYKTISFLKEAASELDFITQSIVKEANENEYEIKFKKHKRNLF